MAGPRRSARSRVLVHLLLAAFAAYSPFPLLWALVTSLKRPQDTVAYPPRWIPDPLTFQNYVEVLTRTAVPWQILNTMLAASLAAVIVVAASSLAGYGFSRFDFRGKQFLLLSLLACVMVSGATKVVPLFMPLNAPSGPNTTERTSSSLPTHSITKSHPDAASRGLGADLPPYSLVHCAAFAGVRL